MQWGSVYWGLGADRHPLMVVTSSKQLAASQRVHVLRCTSHTTNRAAGDIVQPCFLGDSPVLFPDSTSPLHFPQTNRVRFSLAAGYHIETRSKSDLLDPSMYAAAGVVYDRFHDAVRAEIASALHGLPAPPVIRSGKKPPWCMHIKQGDIHAQRGSSDETFVIISHNSVHEYYVLSNIMLLPVADFANDNILRRYDFHNIFTHNPNYEPSWGLSAKPVASLTLPERSDVLAVIDHLLESK